ncbi:hypothetical protein GCM10010156_74080 [Planobispora rosea]|uniref:Transposase IS4-like domain-containing protein n=1 Tax=Planobispora rosea TaxID=35762 RepID=A0A8J3S7X1_PLARO|nr:hypothetical protein GCM10010156_74080 [Planobispora rosea]GIH88943.1 hypothetical protein Pro02_73510 [Planobispora rosea]
MEAVDGEALGRSRGGLSSTLHLAVDTCCRVLAVILSAGQAGDNPHLIPLLDQVRPPLGYRRPAGWWFRVIADKAYSARATRGYLRRRRIAATIPEKKDQLAQRRKRGARGGRPYTFDPEIYKRRNVVERAIARLKRYRALASRYAKRAVIHRSQILLVATADWLS